MLCESQNVTPIFGARAYSRVTLRFRRDNRERFRLFAYFWPKQFGDDFFAEIVSQEP